ncbi:MAG: redox-regulated ATPase YchF [Candidatus Thermoplasmatota archaeon]|nr:redox-regulated ATPase YchF [Candidatus Thermoplasmatota archaeon]
MELGLVGKPNVGKSTFFSAATLAPAEAANYPFTTIEANRGIGYVRVPCPHVELGLEGCDPNNAPCRDGIRWVPVELVDVAGLVPGAHEGKGLGNKFLDDLRQAAALVHVVDAAGATNAEGEPVDPGTHDPSLDVDFLTDEVERWFKGILWRDFDRAARRIDAEGLKVDEMIHDRLSGLGVAHPHVVAALRETQLNQKAIKQWTEEDALDLARAIRRHARPVMVAANKADLATDEQLSGLKEASPDPVLPTAADAELALRRADDAGLIDYDPGADSFEITGELAGPQEKGLSIIQEKVLDRFGTTGVQDVLEHGVFQVLDRIAVFPVEDESHFADGAGNVLPDVYLVPRGTTAEQMAFRVHTDIGEGFIRAVDAKSKRTVGADHELQHGDVIRIVSKG